jgi:hypothetical protein
MTDEHVDLRRWVAKVERENELLHMRMGFWRERAGMLEEGIRAALEGEGEEVVRTLRSCLRQADREMGCGVACDG